MRRDSTVSEPGRKHSRHRAPDKQKQPRRFARQRHKAPSSEGISLLAQTAAPGHAFTRDKDLLSAHWLHLVALFKLSGVLVLALAVVMAAIIWVRASGGEAFAQQAASPASAESPAEDPTAPTTPAFAALPLGGGALSQKAAEVVAAVEEAKEEREASLRAAAGWQTTDGGRRYRLEDGSMATGVLNLNGVSLTFSEEGLWLSSRLDVPYIPQLPDMPSGCEVVALTMMLNYAGVEVSKEELAARLPYASDPNEGFTGSLYADGSSGLGGVIWPAGLLALARDYQPGAVDLTGEPWEVLQGHIDEGRPVCVWFITDGLYHTVLLTGYSAASVWVNDPLVDKDVELDINTFLSRWEQNGHRALSY